MSVRTIGVRVANAALEWLLTPRRLPPREPGAFDELIKQRVRTLVNDITHEPPTIEVRVRHGHVTLHGRVHADQMLPLLDAVKSIPGVRAVEDRLHLREPLHPPPPPRRYRLSWWTPVLATLVGAIGAVRSRRQEA